MRADGTITDIDEMQAETTNNHCQRNNGVYALEMSCLLYTTPSPRDILVHLV